MKTVRLGKGVVCAIAWVILMGAGIWRWTSEQAAARAGWARVEALQDERVRLRSIFPPLDASGEQQVAGALAAEEGRLAELRARLTAAKAAEPPTALDVLFDLTQTLEQARGEADRAGISLSPGEQFGFATYRRQAPDPSERALVGRQLAGLRPLLAALIEARPRAILAVQRERPPTPAGDPVDFFVWDRGRSLGHAGVLDATAFRVEFTGKTPALRAFLSRVADPRAALVVRSVEVTPATSDPWPPLAAGEGPVTVVSSGWSRFVVVVEHLAAIPPS